MTQTATREKPIIFSGEMVRAILAGRKTQTRRLVKPQPTLNDSPHGRMWGHKELAGEFADHVFGDCAAKLLACPFGEVGSRLWIRETWRWYGRYRVGVEGGFQYRADLESRVDLCKQHHGEFLKAWDHGQVNKWRSPIHMPRWASRLTLEITGIRVERLQEITEADALAEGFMRLPATGRVVLNQGGQRFGNCWPTAREGFAELWDSLNGAKPGCAWESNPWCWCISFVPVPQPHGGSHQ